MILSSSTNAFHWSLVKHSTGPAVFFESRARAVLPANATSTHWPLALLHELFRQTARERSVWFTVGTSFYLSFSASSPIIAVESSGLRATARRVSKIIV